MGLPWIATLAPAAADDDGISLSQTPGAAGNLTITGALASGGVATLDVARRVLVTTASDESGKTLIIYGTNRNGGSITETMTGPNATTGYTAQDFKTVTRVAVSAAFTGAVKVGTNGVASSPWYLVNRNATIINIGIGVVVSGTVSYVVQNTYDEIEGHYAPGYPGNWTTPGTPTVFDDPVGGSSTSDQFQIVTPVRAVRLTLNSFSAPGSATITLIQSDVRG